MKQIRKRIWMLLLCLVFMFQMPVMAKETGAKKAKEAPAQSVEHSIAGKSATISAGELSKSYRMTGMSKAAVNSEPYYLTEVQPKDNTVITKGQKMYVKFYARDTWQSYYTKPLLAIFDSKDEIVYSSFGMDVVSVSGQDVYSGYLDWNTRTAAAGKYYLYIVNAPCYRNGTTLDDWSEFDCPYILTKFTLKGSGTTIKLDANGGKCSVSSLDVSSKGSTKLPQATRSGYTFLGWYTAKTGGTKINPSVYTFKNGQTIYAHWRANKYTISFQANGGSVSTAKKTVTYGSACGTLPVPKRTKGSFLGWYTSKTGGTKYTSATKYRVAGNTTLYAHWEMPKYTVKFAGNGGKASVGSKTVAYGSKIGSLPSASRSKYSFLGWYTEKSGGTKITTSYKVTKDITFYAHWKMSTTGGDDRETCIVCGGKGYKTCMTCGGSGLYYWSGEGYKTCHGCRGTGTRTCTECNGRGYH